MVAISEVIGTVHKITVGAVTAFAKIGSNGDVTITRTATGNANGYVFDKSTPDIVEAIAAILIECARLANSVSHPNT